MVPLTKTRNKAKQEGCHQDECSLEQYRVECGVASLAPILFSVNLKEKTNMRKRQHLFETQTNRLSGKTDAGRNPNSHSHIICFLVIFVNSCLGFYVTLGTV